MKTLLFIAIDEPEVLAFYSANIPLPFSLVFISDDLMPGVTDGTTACVAMPQCGERSIMDWATEAVTLAKGQCEKTGCSTVLCLMPYAEFLEIISSEVSLSVPDSSFFDNHFYGCWRPNEAGMLFELRILDDQRVTLHLLTQEEFNLLPFAN